MSGTSTFKTANFIFAEDMPNVYNSGQVVLKGSGEIGIWRGGLKRTRITDHDRRNLENTFCFVTSLLLEFTYSSTLRRFPLVDQAFVPKR